MAVPKTTEEFVQLLERSGLVDSDVIRSTVAQIAASVGNADRPVTLARQFLRRGLITRYQATQLLAGRYKGFLLSKYRILDLLGEGGMGRVYLAEHRVMHRKVALKVLPKNKASDPSAIARFQREAQAVAALNHPNIVQAYDIDHEGDLHFLVMEYVKGISAQDAVARQGRLPWRQACQYARQAAVGLEQANRAGVVHRDIKPANLLIDESGTVKVLDMGLAVFFDRETGQSRSRLPDEAVVGTADYLAPEQTIDSHRVDIRADIYALGGTLYFMLTGQPPYPTGTVADKLEWHRTRPPQPIRELAPDVPDALVAVVERMMAKDPRSRYQSPAEVDDALAPFAATERTDLVAGGQCQVTWQEPDDEIPLLSEAASISATSAVDADLVDFFAVHDAAASVPVRPRAARSSSARPQPDTPRTSTMRRNLLMVGSVAAGITAAAVIGVAWFRSNRIVDHPPTRTPDPSATATAISASKILAVPSRAYPQIDWALSEAGDGQIVEIQQPGPWKLLSIRISPSFLDDKHGVTMVGLRSNTVLERAQPQAGPLIVIEATQRFVLRNLVFDGSGANGPLLEIRGGNVAGVAIEGCTIRNFRGPAIRISSANASGEPLRITGCSVQATDRQSIGIAIGAADESADSASRNLHIERLRVTGTYNAAIEVAEPVAPFVVENCVFSGGDVGLRFVAPKENWSQIRISRNLFDGLSADVSFAEGLEAVPKIQSDRNRWKSVGKKALESTSAPRKNVDSDKKKARVDKPGAATHDPKIGPIATP